MLPPTTRAFRCHRDDKSKKALTYVAQTFCPTFHISYNGWPLTLKSRAGKHIIIFIPGDDATLENCYLQANSNARHCIVQIE